MLHMHSKFNDDMSVRFYPENVDVHSDTVEKIIKMWCQELDISLYIEILPSR